MKQPSLYLSLSFALFNGTPIKFYYLLCVFFWLGLKYVKCIKTIAWAEEPQSVFIYEAQLWERVEWKREGESERTETTAGLQFCQYCG